MDIVAVGTSRSLVKESLGLAAGNNQAGVLPEQPQRGGSLVTGHNAVNTILEQNPGRGVSSALYELCSQFGHRRRGERQGRLAIANVPSQFLDHRMHDETGITRRKPFNYF